MCNLLSRSHSRPGLRLFKAFLSYRAGCFLAQGWRLWSSRNNVRFELMKSSSNFFPRMSCGASPEDDRRSLICIFRPLLPLLTWIFKDGLAKLGWTKIAISDYNFILLVNMSVNYVVTHEITMKCLIESLDS